MNSEIVKAFSPFAQFAKHIPGCARNQDVTGVSTLDDLLGSVDAGAGCCPNLVQVFDPVDGPAVNSHSDFDIRLRFECSRNLESAFSGAPGNAEEYERYSIDGRSADQLAGRPGSF